MADDSFQNELPPSRVNIRYVKDTAGAREEVELPHRVVVAGDFSFRQDDTPLEKVKKIPINKRDFDSVMESLDVQADMNVPNKLVVDDEDAELLAHLEFKSMKDFHPENVVKQVPELDALVKIRGLLTDLRARVILNRDFRKELERILKDKSLTDDLMDELGKVTVKAGSEGAGQGDAVEAEGKGAETEADE